MDGWGAGGCGGKEVDVYRDMESGREIWAQPTEEEPEMKRTKTWTYKGKAESGLSEKICRHGNITRKISVHDADVRTALTLNEPT